MTDDKPRTRTLAEVFTAELARNKPPLVINAATQQAFKQMAERHRTMLAAFAQPAANSYARTVMAGMQPALAAHLRNSQVFEDVGKSAGLATGGMQLALAAHLRNSQVFEDVGKSAGLATAAAALASAMRALSPPRTDWSNLIDTINKQANPIDQVSVGRWDPPLPTQVRGADPPPVPELEPALQPTLPEPTEPDYEWRNDPRVGLAVLLLALCITIPVSTYFVLGPDAWHELRDDTSWYLTVILAVLAGLNGTHRR